MPPVKKIPKTVLDRADLERIETQKKKIHQKKQEIIDGLPHLYGYKWYAWARAYFTSRNAMNLCCASNQSTKSSTQIRKVIDWATDQKKWPTLWPGRTPKIFWYFYPSKDVADVEFEKKWIAEFLPRGKYKTDPTYGWRAEYENEKKKEISALHFNSGITVYFKVYAQAQINLQSSSLDAIFADEEMPAELYNELMARTFSTDGYFHMVFTATLGQEMWLRAIEGKGDTELFPNAFKQQITMYDCMYYDDGSPGQYDNEKIERAKAKCSTAAEIQKRVYGRFIADIGRKYSTFDPARHYIKPFKIPIDWKHYGAADVGSGGPGGKESHPGACCFVAIRPDYQMGVVYRAWRGDEQVTSAGDIFNKFIELRGQDSMTQQNYDQASKDFETIANAAGEAFEKSEKSHEIGEQIINTLFKNDMMFFFDDDPEIAKLGGELVSLLKSTPKNKAKDDLADAFRYTITKAPWDFSVIKLQMAERQVVLPLWERPVNTLSANELMQLQIMERRGEIPRLGEETQESWSETEAEIAHWNEQYGN